jgi:hypothetical protein
MKHIHKQKTKKASSQIALVAVFSIIIISVVGYLAYLAQQKVTYTHNLERGSGKYLSIPSWQVRVPQTLALANVKLGEMKESSQDFTDQFVTILAPELDASWQCKANDGVKGSLGTVSRTIKDKKDSPFKSIETVKIGEFTYGFETPTSNCTDDPNYALLVKEFKNQFIKLRSY